MYGILDCAVAESQKIYIFVSASIVFAYGGVQQNDRSRHVLGISVHLFFD